MVFIVVVVVVAVTAYHNESNKLQKNAKYLSAL
jgi:hypothetical protein